MTPKHTDASLDQLRADLDRDPERAPQLAALAKSTGWSVATLSRRFAARFGLSPRAYQKARRLERLRGALRDGGDATSAIFDAGFGAASRVYGDTLHLIGMTPARYAKGGEGLELRYTLVDSPVGRLLIAASERGICAVTPGTDDATLIGGLQQEFPRARLQRVDENAVEWFGTVLAQVSANLGLDGRRRAIELPVDLLASAFSWRVWQALTRIPRGTQISYQQLAQQIGAPRSFRAVARACASNRLAIVVPCHRVIRSDGSLGGYRWGLPLKRELLDREIRDVDPTPGDRLAPGRGAANSAAPRRQAGYPAANPA